ncbi:phosphodiester glycosidase family protein [Lutibacter sp. A80]|uniref:phosphodiester glycosidase family protein n=1 Tax=Lutibacter sp. A80 TaxID=2918453 RepID=UPI001F05758B|nr:phosphodiester glycosidase family protein [Lutibacter sp. A80]UMB60685.1 phosphodiester glycosidase family protein [Lutibacter sp. A80]
MKKMQHRNHLTVLLIIFNVFITFSQQKKGLNSQQKSIGEAIEFIQIKTDTLFNSNQIISLLILQKNAANKYNLAFGYNNTELVQTSTIAKKNNAIAAINGGFFNMKDGGSVTYFEVNDTVINKTSNPNNKLMDGAIIIKNDFDITLELANSDHYYEASKQEAAVLITGPLLLQNSKALKLPDMKFVNNRHPRTCLCKTEESVILITIDGRQKEAHGMNLMETQDYLKTLNCIDAINLDGGGSTTMWLQDKGIVNFPSDITGERPVANALLIIDKVKHNKIKH